MSLPTLQPRRWLALAAGAATLLAALAGCGGSDPGLGSGGTGTSNDTVAIGTVDGFGSIYVAGERCEHLGARVLWDTYAGGPEAAADPNPDVRLGQRLELTLDGASAGCRVLAARIAPEVVGTVSAVSPLGTPPTLTVAGAEVIVNTDAAEGPVTVFDGYDGVADVAVGDRVEVHGKAVPNGTGVAIRATRIERKPSSDAWVRVAGVVGNLDADSFTLGGLTVNYGAGTTVLPSGFTLRNGLTVAVWSAAAVQPGNVLDARAIRVLRRQFANGERVRLQGPVSGCNGASPCSEPVIDGVTVQITAGTTFTHGSAADVADGRVLHVRGSFDAASGKLVARAVAVRRGDPDAGLVTLVGSVSDFATDGTQTFLRVRGVPVVYANSAIDTNCTIEDNKLVAVAGRIEGSSVRATRIGCPALAVGMVIDVYGQIESLDSTARTFKINGRPLPVLEWTDDTVFRNGAAPGTLANGQYVALRSVYQGGNRFVVQRLVLDDTPPASPTGGLVFGAFGIANRVGPDALRVNLLPLAVVTPGSVVFPGVANGVPVRAWFYRDVPNARWVALRVRPVLW